MKLLLVRQLMLGLFAIPLCLSAQSPSAVNGKVVDQSQHGVPNLQVKLRPPATAQVPVKIVVTDQGGAFSFAGVPGGRYLLEVSQGPYVLYRAQVNAPSAPLTLPVQRR